MRERKYVKFKVSMYDDTKFKIIDMKPERDLVHYVWTRVVVLAGKVNLEGELYLSKNIPYTIETLAIEFNRDIDAIKAAFDVLMELEMVEFTEDKVYKVINFAKHQNIKINKKDNLLDAEENVKHKDNEIKEDSNKKEPNNNDKEVTSTDKKSEEKVTENETKNVKDDRIENKQSDNISRLRAITIKNINVANDNMDHNREEKNLGDNKISSETDKSVSIVSEVKNSDMENKKKKKENSFEMAEESEEEDICGFIDGEYKLAPGERLIKELSFS